MTRKSKSLHGIGHGGRFRLNPTTRAIRSAIALGLALATSAPVFAGSCVLTPPATYTCNGAFDHSLGFAAIDDLTVVIGDAGDTSISGDVGDPGLLVLSYYGGIDLSNAGDVTSYGADAILAIAPYGDISIDSSGTLLAEGGSGIFAYSYYGDVAITNSGAIESTGQYAFGIVAYSYNADITNSGDVVANAEGYAGASAVAIQSLSAGFAEVENDGALSASAAAYVGDAVSMGAYVIGSDVTTLTNDGSIHADAATEYGSATAYGALVFGGWGGIALASNYGDISAEASVGYYGVATAVGVLTAGNVATVVNDGSIDASAYAYIGGASATGAQVYALWGAIYSYGDISAEAEVVYGAAIASGANAYGYFGSSLYNAGDIQASATAFYGNARAIGAESLSVYYGSYVTNEGSISASASVDYGNAVAAGSSNVASFLGDAITTNNGDISASASSFVGDATAFGAYNYTYAYGSSIENAGGISASAETHYGDAVAIGAFAYGAVIGDVSVINSGDISADASTVYGAAAAVGVHSNAFYYGTSLVANEGSIAASADAAYGSAFAVGAYSIGSIYSSAYVVNAGDITATAMTNEGLARAYGSYVSGKYYAVTINEGDISAVAESQYVGDVLAMGSYTSGKYGAALYSDGSIVASAYAGDGLALARAARVSATYGDALAYSAGEVHAYAYSGGGVAAAIGIEVYSSYGSAIIENAGDISVVAIGNTASAAGAKVIAYYDAIAYNGGDISVEVEGEAGRALGLVALSYYGDIFIQSSGDITATARGDYVGAVGVLMASYGTNTLVNEGVISATGDYIAMAIYSTAEAVAQIYNYGTITGSIQTGDLGDYLYNEGTWNARQTSHFGAGDDSIVNAGTITLNSAIDLGDFAAAGNAFHNEGTLRVNGAGNWIDMGVDNPLAFLNTGLISFVDGAANDMLTLYGDFTGNGSVAVDWNGQSGATDVLFIDGDIVGSSLTRINVNPLAALTSVSTEFDAIRVSGTSLASNFTLGTLNAPADAFLSYDLRLLSDIDASNATADVFSIAVDVTGLSARGVLATSIAPGVQNLWHAAVGTVTGRDGAVREQDESGVSLSLRSFSEGGDISPDGSARDFGSSGSQVFEQQSSGIEAGIDYRFNDAFSAGLSFGNADADVDPSVGGAGRIDADTFSLHATWTPNERFYLDGAYRKLDYNLDATVAGGAFADEGAADGYSLEAGYRYQTHRGMIIEPQLQYSRVDVDGFSVDSSWGDLVVADADSARLRAGVSLRKSFETQDGHRWTPYLTLSSVREGNADNAYSINGSFHGRNDMGGNSRLVETGASGQFGAWAVLANLNWQDGGAFDSVFGGQLALRYTFGKSAR